MPVERKKRETPKRYWRLKAISKRVEMNELIIREGQYEFRTLAAAISGAMEFCRMWLDVALVIEVMNPPNRIYGAYDAAEVIYRYGPDDDSRKMFITIVDLDPIQEHLF
jgi:hypothetical protein